MVIEYAENAQIHILSSKHKANDYDKDISKAQTASCTI